MCVSPTGRGGPTKVVCAECMKMCCLGGKNSVGIAEKQKIRNKVGMMA